MTPSALQAYLHARIPLSGAMQVQVSAIDADRLTLTAPLPPNINHRETVFGGSASALAILSAWSLLHVRLTHEGSAARLVIQSNTMDYDHPILGDFTATAELTDPRAWSGFVETLGRRGKARIRVASRLECERRTVGRFEGAFVALAQPSA